MSRVGIDIDGVLYPFDEELKKFLLSDDWPWAVGSLPTPTRWEFYLDWGMDLQGFLSACEVGTRKGRLFRHGDPYPGAVKQLRRLQEAGHTVVLITNRDFISREVMEKETCYWLAKNCIPYDELHIVKDKRDVKVDYHIDDNEDNWRKMDDYYGRSYLCDRPWNQGVDTDWRRVTLEEYVDIILEERAVSHDGRSGQNGNNETQSEVRVVSATGGAKGQKMARLGSLDPQALLKVAEVAGFGEIKYDRLNYMKGYDWSLTFDAGMRHRLAFWSGEDFDPESGLPHLAHAAWHDLCLLAFFLHDLGSDNRYRKP